MKKNAFTFTELMVIIAVITVFTAISFPYYKNIRQSLSLERTAVKFAQDIRRAQEMSMSAYEFGGDVPDGGYGIYFNIAAPDSDHYIIFADLNGNKDYDEDELVENIYLEEGIELENCGLFQGDCEEFLAVYLPPDPIGFFKAKPVGGGWGFIPGFGSFVEISIADNGKNKTINLNKAGLVDID